MLPLSADPRAVQARSLHDPGVTPLQVRPVIGRWDTLDSLITGVSPINRSPNVTHQANEYTVSVGLQGLEP